MNIQSVSFGKQTGTRGGILGSVGGSLLNVGATVGVGAGIGAGIGKLASLTPYTPTAADLKYQYADMFERAVGTKETPSYIQEAGDKFTNLVAKGKKLLKSGRCAQRNGINLEVCRSAAENATDEVIKSSEFQRGIKKIIKGKMPEGGFTREQIIERLAQKSEKTAEFLQKNGKKITETAEEFVDSAASCPRMKELAEKGAKHLRNKTIVGAAIAIGVIGALVLNILKTYGILKFRMPKKMQERVMQQAQSNPALKAQLAAAQTQNMPQQ